MRLRALLLALLLTSCLPTTEEPAATEGFTVSGGALTLTADAPMLEGDGFVYGPNLKLEPSSPFCVDACVPDAEGVISLTIPTGYGQPEVSVPIVSGEVVGGYFLVTVEGRRGTVDFMFKPTL